MPSKDPGDLKNSMVCIRREAIEVVPSEVPFSTKCLWKDLRDLVEVFGMSLDVPWRSLGGLGMCFGCVSDGLGCPSEVFGRFITVLGEFRRGLLALIFHRNRVSPEGPVDPENSMVFIRREAILGVPP